MKGNKRVPLVLLVILAVSLPLLLIGVKQTLDNRSSAAAADKLEIEGGTLSGNAVSRQDSLASNNYYIELGVNQINSPTPTPTSSPTTNTDIQGYGALTTGGTGKTVYEVTNLNDSGPGSLRDAISQSNRYIKILVSGTLNVTGSANVVGAISTYGQTYRNSMACNSINNITIDGSTAPGNGITIVGTIYFENCNNWIIKHIHARDAVANGTYQDDNFTLLENNHNFVFDHVSMSGAGDGSIDISFGSSDITVQWCIIGPQSVNFSGTEGLPMDVYKDSVRVSIHHNLFYEGHDRHPTVGDKDHPDTTGVFNVDHRNNLIWAPTQGLYGVTFSGNTYGNVVKNYFYLSALGGNRLVATHTGGSAYVSGNYDRRGQAFTGFTSHSETIIPTQFRITEEATAKLAAEAVLNRAGARVGGLDSIDQAKINAIRSIGL